MLSDRIKSTLFALQDVKYRDFNKNLIPTVKPEKIIGVRTPELRSLAKTLSTIDGINDFLSDLPHEYFEENQLHAFIISEIKDFRLCIDELERFLPFIDNWATCDQLSPKVFKKHKKELLPCIKEWIKSDKTYTENGAVTNQSTGSHCLDSFCRLRGVEK